MKRFIALFFVLNVLLCSLTVSANNETVVYGSHEEAEPGETVSITLKLQDNPGLAAWKLELEWDDAALTLDKDNISLDKDFSKGMFVENSNTDGKLALVWANTSNVSADGVLITLTFTVSDAVTKGAYPISITASGTRNQDGDKITVVTNNASVTLADPDGGTDDDEPVVSKPTFPLPSPSQEDDKTPESPSSNTEDYFGTPTVSFSDVYDNAYCYKPVVWAVEQHITAGTSTSTFSPDAPCNRAQTVTFLWRAAGCPQPTLTSSNFTDVAPDAYYYTAVLWAIEQGITSGTSESTFSPEASVTRGQVVTFLWRSAGWDYSVDQNPFTDVSADAYYKTAVCWALSKNITTGTSANTFNPDVSCTRGQIVTFLYRDFMR